jgi:putative Mg2+ transporter-C (MgtC) family protein
MVFYEMLQIGEIDISIIVLRLGLAFLLGGLVGLERELNHQPAGLRTHILISTGACLLTLLSLFITQGYKGTEPGDPSRIAAQIVSGIGFLGAGAIIKFGVNIRGLTTAASVWASAAIGMTVGGGMYSAALITTGFLLFALIILEQLEKKVLPAKKLKVFTIECKGIEIHRDKIIKILKNNKTRVRNINIRQDVIHDKTEYKMIIYVSRNTDLERIYRDFHQRMNNINRLELVQET